MKDPLPKDTLFPGESLKTYDSLVSQNGAYKLILQQDGNLVLYRLDTNKAIWASVTDGKDTHIATMQQDGNFVLYHENGTAAWSSETNKKPGSHLVLQNDGNLVIYWPSPIWSTKTNM